jgi:threonyl-tRNA synthetase
LYEKSWHMWKYDAMMPVMTDKEWDEYVLKAMNCPHHFELYKTQQFSYKELPIRFAENTMVYRNEKSWELQWLTRVKALTQDDTHHFVRHDQIESEIKMILGLMENVYKVFWFNSFKVEISIRDLSNKQNYFGWDEVREKAESVLIETVKNRWVDYSIEEWEAAFYGPKIDIRFNDSIGRSRQLTTVQLDFNQPENFDLYYMATNGQKERPAVLHVTILWSLERFMWVMIEHYAGMFPLWLAPQQLSIVPVAEFANEYAEELRSQAVAQWLRAKVDNSTDSFSKKIRNAELDKVPYILIVWEKEVTDKTVSVRVNKTKEQFTMNAEQFIAEKVTEYKNRQ